MKGPQTKIMQDHGQFDKDVPVETAIALQVRDALCNFLREWHRQGVAGECRSIRAFSRINFTGGVFVLDMRLLPDSEIPGDELYRIVCSAIAHDAAESCDPKQAQENSWTARLDAALAAEFGTELGAQTGWNVAAGNFGGYVTTFETDDEDLRERVNYFIRVFMLGVEATGTV